MINLDKTKQEKCQLPPFKKTCPCTIVQPLFFNFSEPHLDVIKIYCLPLKRGGGGPNYGWHIYLI